MEIENNLPKTFSPEGIEDKWYQKWMETKSFKPRKGKQNETFTVLMPISSLF